MKLFQSISLLAAVVLSLPFISSCNKGVDPDENEMNFEVIKEIKVNNNVSIDGDIEFMILAPDGLTGVAHKKFIMSVKEEGEYDDLNGKSFFSITSTGRYANEIVSLMGYSQNLENSIPGDKLNLERITGGNFLSNNSEISFASYGGGDIYVKSISDTSVTLRFVKVKITNALGNYYFNGDLTFNIE